MSILDNIRSKSKKALDISKKALDIAKNTGSTIRDNSSIQLTIYTVITLGTFFHLLIDSFTSKYLEKEQGSGMVAVYIIGSFVSFIIGFFMFRSISKYITNVSSFVKNIFNWVLLFLLIGLLSFLFYFNTTLIIITVLGALFFIFSNKELTYENFNKGEFNLGDTIENALTRNQFKILKVVLFVLIYQSFFHWITNTEFSTFFDGDYKRVLSLSFWGNMFQLPLFLALLFVLFNTNAVTNFVSWLCDTIGLDNKLSIRTLFFVIVYSTLDAMVRGDDSIFRPDKRKQLSEDSKQPSGLPEEIKCPCTNWDRTMLFETKILYDKVSGANDIDKINRGLDKINEKYEKIFDPKKEKCTSKKAFEDPGVIAALIIIPIAAYVGGGFTLKKYILPGLMFIWSKLSGTPAAPAAPVRAPPAATGGGVRVT